MSNAVRAALLVRALHAGVERDADVIEDLCTEDVRAWTPTVSTTSRTELLAELAQRDGTFSDLALEVATLDVGGDVAGVEWCLTMTHTGPLTVGTGETIEPTGLRVTVNGVTVAEFRGDRICALRQYWDEFAVLEQIGVATVDRSI
jgi:ketosteroid isomerase-like protein